MGYNPAAAPQRESLVINRSAAFLLLLALAAAPVASPAAERFVVRPVAVDDIKAVLATVESVDVLRARARIPGIIDKLVIDEGSEVRAGEVVAVIRDPKLKLRIAAIDARMASLRARRELALTELKRTRELRRKGTVSQARLDTARTRADVVAAEIAAVNAERSVAVEQRRDGEVRAPAAGRVLKVPGANGSVVLAGDEIATIASESYILRLKLPERHARFIRKGDTVLIGPRGLAADTSALGKGRVRQVYPELENGRVIADVEAKGLGDYFVGERTRVYVATGRRITFRIPRDLVRLRFGVSFVRLEKGGEVAVQTGMILGDEVEVLSGLRDGDVLVAP